MPPDLNRLSKESGITPSSPLNSSVPFSSGHKVGRKVISKIKVGGKKIGAATKHTIDKLGDIAGEKRSSGDMHYDYHNPEGTTNGPYEKPVYSPESHAVADSPLVSRAELPSQGEFAANTYREPAPTDFEPATSTGEDYDKRAVGLGLSGPTRPYAMEAAPPSASSLTHQGQSQTWDDSRPYPSGHGMVMSKKEAKGHNYSTSMSGGGKVSKFFGSLDPASKRHSGSSADYSPTQQQRQSSSPKQKSKFAKFMTDLSHQDITGKDARSVSQSAAIDSRPPPPPDKSQFRAPSTGTGLKSLFADLNARDITGARPQDRPKGARAPTLESGAGERRTSGGVGRFFSDLKKRDIIGQTEEERQALARQRDQETTRIPAQPRVYDESASDWEVKIEKMEDVLPHIRRETLADALKQAGGDEQRAIGLAVMNSR